MLSGKVSRFPNHLKNLFFEELKRFFESQVHATCVHSRPNTRPTRPSLPRQMDATLKDSSEDT